MTETPGNEEPLKKMHPIITPDGEFAASLILDEVSRNRVSVAVWAATGRVPQPTIDLIQSSDYAAGIQVIDVGVSSADFAVFTPPISKHENFDESIFDCCRDWL
jgi:hypothetical protein